MNRNWDTPPNGDFARYVEQLTARQAGAGEIGRVGSQSVAARASARQPRPVAARPAPAARMASSAPSPRPMAPPGPPDLSAIFKNLFGQLADEIGKTSHRR